ncbi:MAG: hypothetical protein GEV07_15895 [Streptosporangiales bacterium]|nr:hypothetical protein [Streptosporangiales bacterium]
MHRAKRLGRPRPAVLLLALPAVAGALVVGTATAPPADAGRVQVSDTRFTSTGQQVTVSVQLGPLEKGKLGLTPPGGSKPVEVASGTGPKKLSYTMSLSCPDYDGSCVEDGRRTPASNGKWTVTFGSQVLVLGSGSESSFVVDAPPQTPRGVSADASSKQVAVQWRKGVEPDLTAYKVSVGGRSEQVAVGRACGGSSCSASLPAPGGGGRTPVKVVAIGDGADGQLSSGAAATKVTVPTAAKTRMAGDRRGTGGKAGSSGARKPGGSGFPKPGIGGDSAKGGFPTTSETPASDPYPSFGVRPEVAPVKKSSPTKQRASEPVAYGQARGDVAVPVALALVLVLASWHLLLWSRAGKLRPAFARVRRAARGRHSRR